jgi:putative oxidoreductase
MFFQYPSPRQLNAGLALLRLALGTIFIAHGAQKLFVFGLAGVTGAFGQMGVPMAGFFGPLVAVVEFLGGIALVFGLLTRVASLGLAINMLVATVLVHLPAGLFLPNGYEFTLSLLAATTLLTLTGAGAYSVDALIARRVNGDVKNRAVSLSARRAA